MRKKNLLLGNGAVARGLFEAGCRVVSSYPGTPSTEITEEAAKYEEIYTEWAPNEKVACEVALGASIAGARAFCAMKHVGLNVAADPVFTASYSGVNAGFVIGVADDPGMHSSQNEQDSRHYARASKIPMLEPSDSEECRDFVKAAFEMSEEFDTPVFLRLSTRVSHSMGLVEENEREDVPLRAYAKDAKKYVMMPGNAIAKHVVVEERTKNLIRRAKDSPLNRIEGEGKIGVIVSGVAYEFAKEALGDKVSYLKLGLCWPLSEELVRSFCEGKDEVYIIEELDPFLETEIRAMGLHVKGKALFSMLGEYTSENIRKVILGGTTPYTVREEAVPARPPVLCPGCPHRGLFYALSALKLTVFGDIGCYTLGALAPLFALDTTICMGASISGLHGYNLARGEEAAKKAVAVIGDSTFFHSGITGLIDIIYNKGASKVLILDNRTTGMTGHQENPATGRTLKGEETNEIDIEALCRAIGIKNIAVLDPYEPKEMIRILKEELSKDGPGVLMTKKPCALLKSVKANSPFEIQKDTCRQCGMCLKIGCPAIKNLDGQPEIDASMCVGCSLCQKLCAFGAIAGEGGY